MLLRPKLLAVHVEVMAVDTMAVEVAVSTSERKSQLHLTVGQQAFRLCFEKSQCM